jgi:hypothetical protein
MTMIDEPSSGEEGEYFLVHAAAMLTVREPAASSPAASSPPASMSTWCYTPCSEGLGDVIIISFTVLAVVAELGVAVYKSLIACKSSQLRDLK